MASQVATDAKVSADMDGYYYWLIGRGFSAARALKMVDAKYGKVVGKREPSLGWAWKG